MTSCQDPFADFHSIAPGISRPLISKRVLENIMHHAALAQEAENILGGRHDHPLTATAGGVSRYLKEGHYQRLTDICGVLVPYAQELADFMRREILSDGGMLAAWATIDIPALAGAGPYGAEGFVVQARSSPVPMGTAHSNSMRRNWAISSHCNRKPGRISLLHI